MVKTFQSVVKTQQKTTNPIHFHNICFSKQELTLAKNKATTYAITLPRLKLKFK